MSDDEEYGSAEQPQTSGGRQYHVDVAPGEVAPMMILVGDPARADRVAERFESVDVTRRHREYVVHTGVHEGLPVTVVGTGMGAASTEIAVVELCQCVDEPTMIRCGSTGALQPGIELGDLAITQGALRMEATSHSYVDERFPAVASPEAVVALVQAADERGVAHHVGMTATAAGFYGAQGREIPGFPPRDPGIVDELVRQRVQNLEMEAATLLTLAALRGFRAGAVCAVYATRHAGAFIDAAKRHTAEANCIEVGLQALHHLHTMDGERGERANWHPGLRRA